MKLKVIAKIKTPRLIIRPINLNDVDAYFNAEQASIKEMSPYWSWAKPGKSINDIKEFINFVTKEVTNGLLYACCRIDMLPSLEVDIS